MNKIILFAFGLLFFSHATYGQNFYGLSFKKLSGDSVSLNTYAGKNVLFIVAPLSQTDSAFTQLQAFRNRYGDTLQIIGVLSFEDGYQPANASAIQALYNNSGIVLTEGMYTRKASGTNQSPLLQWLTDKIKNLHFNMDSKGIGQKFFVSGSGRLYAVMPPPVSLGALIMNAIVHTQ